MFLFWILCALFCRYQWTESTKNMQHFISQWQRWLDVLRGYHSAWWRLLSVSDLMHITSLFCSNENCYSSPLLSTYFLSTQPSFFTIYLYFEFWKLCKTGLVFWTEDQWLLRFSCVVSLDSRMFFNNQLVFYHYGI